MKAIGEPKERLTMHGVVRRFEGWRRSRNGGRRIPEDLWQAAADLARRYPISKVSRDLRLDYYELKERVNGRGTAGGFVELKVDEAVMAKQSSAVVEMEDGRGRRLKIALERASGAEVLEWANRFWDEKA